MPIHSVKVFFSIKNVCGVEGGGEGGSAGYGPPLPSALPMVETVFNLTLERWAIFTMMPYFYSFQRSLCFWWPFRNIYLNPPEVFGNTSPNRRPNGRQPTYGVDAICGLSLLLVLSFAPRDFSPGTPVFPSPQKPTFPNFNSTRNQVDEEPLCECATCKSLFIYLFYLFNRLFQTSNKFALSKRG